MPAERSASQPTDIYLVVMDAFRALRDDERLARIVDRRAKLRRAREIVQQVAEDHGVEEGLLGQEMVRCAS